mmetsp:Transcript_2093/g.6028  ORF Transcript_2093/g.6028 Transcript_2093/m.6028 type:complete len:203 (+) Transcript_2093:222-830(+)
MATTTTTPTTARSTSTDRLQIGGDKGHHVETISGHLLTLYNSYRWKMIPRCTGRYTCRDHALVSTLMPLQVLSKVGINYEEQTVAQTSPSVAADSVPRPLRQYILSGISGKDRIIVVPLDGDNMVGLITYVKADDSSRVHVGEACGSETNNDNKVDGSSDTTRYVHTFNAASGFRRKLEAMGASVTDDGISYGGKHKNSAES